MRPEQAARTLAVIGTVLLIIASLVRVVAAYILTIDSRFLPRDPIDINARNPVMGGYVLSQDRRQVSFSRGVTIPTNDAAQTLWVGNSYRLDLDNGSIQAGAPDREMKRFEVRNNDLVILDPDLKEILDEIPMAVFAISETGDHLLYAQANETGPWKLFAVRGASEPVQIAEGRYFTDLSWSRDGSKVLFVAPADLNDEIFVYDFVSNSGKQLTGDRMRKQEPIFSPDGQQVAYLATDPEVDLHFAGRVTPTPLVLPPMDGFLATHLQADTTEVFIIDAAGGRPTRLTENQVNEFDLSWAADGKVFYSVWQHEWPLVAWLYGVDPESREVTRIYPNTAIDSLSCEPDPWGANKALVRLTVSNSGKQALDFPIEISMDRAPLDVVTGRSQHRVQREEIRLNSGEVRALEYSIPVVNEQKVFLAATIETGVEFPLAVVFCEVEPRTLFLPRLRWFGVTLGLIFFGCILAVPWLRHQKKPWLWRVWMLFLGFFTLLVGIESAAILGWLG